MPFANAASPDSHTDTTLHRFPLQLPEGSSYLQTNSSVGASEGHQWVSRRLVVPSTIQLSCTIRREDGKAREGESVLAERRW